MGMGFSACARKLFGFPYCLIRASIYEEENTAAIQRAKDAMTARGITKTFHPGKFLYSSKDENACEYAYGLPKGAPPGGYWYPRMPYAKGPTWETFGFGKIYPHVAVYVTRQSSSDLADYVPQLPNDG